jgi:acylphosphatase
VNVVRQVIFRGRVQGVGFRAFVEMSASRKALEGWVRNRRDGTVEAVFSGEAAIVERVLVECREGPPLSRVDGVDQREARADELSLRGGERFAVLPTV